MSDSFMRSGNYEISIGDIKEGRYHVLIFGNQDGGSDCPMILPISNNDANGDIFEKEENCDNEGDARYSGLYLCRDLNGQEGKYRKIIILDYVDNSKKQICIKEVFVPHENSELRDAVNRYTLNVASEVVANDNILMSVDALKKSFGEDKLKQSPEFLSLSESPEEENKDINILDIYPKNLDDLSVRNRKDNMEERTTRLLFQVFMTAAKDESADHPLPGALFNSGNDYSVAGGFLCTRDMIDGCHNILNDTQRQELCFPSDAFCDFNGQYIEAARNRNFREHFFEGILSKRKQSSFSQIVNYDEAHFVSMGGAVKRTSIDDGKQEIEIAAIISDSYKTGGEISAYERFLYHELNKYSTVEGIKSELKSYLEHLCVSIQGLLNEKSKEYNESLLKYTEIEDFIDDSGRWNDEKVTEEILKKTDTVEKTCYKTKEVEDTFQKIREGIKFLAEKKENIELKFHPIMRVDGRVDGESKQSYFASKGGGAVNACGLFAIRSGVDIKRAAKNPRFFEKVAELEKEAQRKRLEEERKKKTKAIKPQNEEKKLKDNHLVEKRKLGKIPFQLYPITPSNNKRPLKTRTYTNLRREEVGNIRAMKRAKSSDDIFSISLLDTIREKYLENKEKENFKRTLKSTLKDKKPRNNFENIFEEVSREVSHRLKEEKIEITDSIVRIREFYRKNIFEKGKKSDAPILDFSDKELVAEQIYHNVFVGQLMDNIEKRIKREAGKEKELRGMLDSVINAIEDINDTEKKPRRSTPQK